MLKLILQLALGALIGGSIAIFFLSGGGDILPHIMPLIGSVISITIVALIGIIVHELGHLVFGLLTGYKFSSFRVGSFIWFKEDGKIRFNISRSFVAGQCLMIPSEKPENFKFVLYNLGGGLLNILFCAFLFIIFIVITMVTRENTFWHTLLITGILMNGILALVNLVPIKSLTNDGANIREALKSKEAARGMHMMLYINNQTMEGKRYRDFDENLFKVEEGADLKNYMVAYLVILEAARLEDLGQHDAVVDFYNRLDINKMPPLYRAMVKADLLYYYTIYHPDFDQAKEIYKDKKLRNFLKMELPTFMRISAAYEFFVMKDKEKGLKLLKKAKKNAQNLPNKGHRLIELEYIQKLEILMQKGTEHAK